MSFPNITAVPSIGFNLPSLPSYQKWAINRDTNTLVLVEFVYEKTTQPSAQAEIPAMSQESISLLNTTLQQASALINTQLQTLENRMNILEILINNIVPTNIPGTGTL